MKNRVQAALRFVGDNFNKGEGIVAGSVAESKLKEIDNKIAALRQVIEMAEEL